MPTNANTFNSRVTSEALEAKFRQVFPAQGGAELVQDLFASGVIQPIIDFSSVAEGSILPQNLQTALDVSTTRKTAAGNTQTLTSTPGFWQINHTVAQAGGGDGDFRLNISDGISTYNIFNSNIYATTDQFAALPTLVIFLRAGDTLSAVSSNGNVVYDVSYRQIADVYGNLVNPTGFVFQ